MPYSQSLASRVRDALTLARHPYIQEKKMFGGVGFLLNGNMLVGVWKDSLIVRVGSENYPASLREPHVRPFDITGKAMTGWVMVEPEGIDDEQPLRNWIDRGLAFVRELPAK